MALPLSGVVISKNEADRIGRCLQSLSGLCAELIVVDSGSTDDTVAIARALGAQVSHRDWLGFAAQKNHAISLASQPWVLLLDADEWLEPPAQAGIAELFASGRVEQNDVWKILRRVHFLGTRLHFSGFSREPIERLFRRHLRHVQQRIHEPLDTRGSRIGRTRVWMEHDTARSAQEYWQKLQRYAVLWAQDQLERGRRSAPGRGLLAGCAYLLKNLLVRGGWMDGPGAWRFHWLHAKYAALKYRLLREKLRAG